MKDIITLVTLVEDVSLISLSHISPDISAMSDIFGYLAENDINVDMITQSVSMGGDIVLGFTVNNRDVAKALALTQKLQKQNANIYADVSVGNFKLSFYSEKMRRTIGVAAYLFSLFKENGLEMKLVSTSETDISCLFADEYIDKALSLAARTFGEISR